MGFVTLGIFVFNGNGLAGSIFQMISHGIISAALFLCVGVVYDRMHSRKILDYGGVVNKMPRFSTLFLIFILASIGLPGTSGFIGEFLILLGVFKNNYFVALIAALGVVLSACYGLWLYKRVIFGKIVNSRINELVDLNKKELLVLTFLVLLSLILGVYPNIILDTVSVSTNNIIYIFNEKTNIKMTFND